MKQSFIPVHTNLNTRFAKYILLATLAFVFSLWSASANSQEETNFSGFYGGLETGLFRTDETVIGRVHGVYYGGFVGGRKQFKNKIILGLEGHIGTATNKASLMIPNSPIIINLNVGRMFNVNAIVGYAVSKKVMVFVDVGLVNVKVTASSPQIPGSLSRVENDLLFGGGFEVKMTKKFNGRFKFAYTDFSGFKIISALAGVTFNF